MQEICIIIPCYNEEKRLPVQELIAFYNENTQYCFCLVNDGSSDKTLDILNDIRKSREERISVNNLAKNSGKAEAIRQSMNFCLNWKEFSYIGYLDADLSTPLNELNYLTSFINGNYDIITGSRIKRMGAVIERNPKRHYLGRIFSTISSMILRLPFYDTQCGAKIIKKEIVPILFDKPFMSKWLFDVEMFSRLRNRFGESYALTKIYEAPLNEWIEKGKSKIGLSYFFKVPFELLRIHRKYNRKRKH